MSVEDQFGSAIEAAGLIRPAVIFGDGKLHRFSPTGKRGDLAGWYVLHLDDVPAGCFGDWRTGYQENWCAKEEGELTPAERQVQRERIRATQEMREVEQCRRYGEAASGASALWNAADPVTDHPYLARKGVQPHGTRSDGYSLLIPMRDTAGELHSLQRIMPDGDKRFMPYGRTRGCYFSIGKPDGVVYVAEGFATGASVHEATGHAVAVGFTTVNLLPVALALRAKYPALRIVIAADDDHLALRNSGRTAAAKAALAVGGMVAVPLFPPKRPDKATDFNDLHAIAGLAAVRACFAELEGT